MSKRPVRGRPAPTSPRARLTLERLEDRLAPHTGVALFSAGLTAGALPTGIIQGPDANRWFAEFAANKIARITASGTITEFALPTAGSGPLYLTVGPDNNIWF